MNYLLNKDNVPYLEPDLAKWAMGWGTMDRRVARTDLKGGGFVSTVFLAIDHGFSQEPGADPVLFETMVFYAGQWLEGMTRRYSFWPEAVQGHAEVVEEACKFVASVRASVHLVAHPVLMSRNRREGKYLDRLKAKGVNTHA